MIIWQQKISYDVLSNNDANIDLWIQFWYYNALIFESQVIYLNIYHEPWDDRILYASTTETRLSMMNSQFEMENDD